MDKRFWIILGVIAAVFVGFLLFQGGDEANAPENGDTQGSQHIVGNQDSGVLLVEYGDYQCPACLQFYPVVDQVKDKYNDSIAFQFKNLPLTQIHPNAFAAARAAEAAGLQDKYWEMHDLLFQSQQAWAQADDPRSTFEQYAKQLNLDVEQFNEDFGSSQVNSIINADVKAFNATGETMSTPTFFLNGEKITPEATLESFSEIIDQAIKDSNQESDNQ